MRMKKHSCALQIRIKVVILHRFFYSTRGIEGARGDIQAPGDIPQV
jgi:hypothetical protein